MNRLKKPAEMKEERHAASASRRADLAVATPVADVGGMVRVYSGECYTRSRILREARWRPEPGGVPGGDRAHRCRSGARHDGTPPGRGFRKPCVTVPVYRNGTGGGLGIRVRAL